MIKEQVVKTEVSQNRKMAALVMTWQTSGIACDALRADNVPTVFATLAGLLKLLDCDMYWLILSCLADPMRGHLNGQKRRLKLQPFLRHLKPAHRIECGSKGQIRVLPPHLSLLSYAAPRRPPLD